MNYIYFILFFAFININVFSQEEPEFKLVQYYFVELIRNNDRPDLDSASVMKIQEGHMNNMKEMAQAGKLLCAGPFGDERGGGIWVLKTESLEVAKELCENDPAVINNRLKYDIRPWWTSEGTFSLEEEN